MTRTLSVKSSLYPVVDISKFKDEVTNLRFKESGKPLDFIVKNNMVALDTEELPYILENNSNKESIYFEDFIREHLPYGFVFHYYSVLLDVGEMEIMKYSCNATSFSSETLVNI